MSHQATNRCRCLCIAGVSLALALAAQGQPRLADCEDLRDLQPRWAEMARVFGVPGYAVTVVKGDEVILADGFGFCEPQKKAPVDADTMFYIASSTKPYVAMAIVALAEDGKLGLDDPIRKHLPRFQLADPDATTKLTLRDLLCHRPGLVSEPIVFNDAFSGLITEDLYYRLLRKVRPQDHLDYSNLHFTLLGRVVESASGQSWKDYLESRIFKPAGMSRTTAYASRMYSDPNAAKPLIEEDGEWVVSPLVKTDRTMHAAGGLGTTAHDLGRWLRLNINGGEINGKRILSEASVRQMQKLQGEAPPDGRIRRFEGFGLGWRVGTYRGRPYAAHQGGYTGAASHVSFLPREKLGVAIVINASGTAAALCDMISIDVFDRLLGLEEKDLFPTYRKEAERRRGQSSSTAMSPNPALVKGKLSRPAEEYAGQYHNADYGTIRLSLEEDELRLQWGDLRPALHAAGMDEFAAVVVPGSPESPTKGRFLTKDGKVVGIRLMVNANTPAVFERQPS